MIILLPTRGSEGRSRGIFKRKPLGNKIHGWTKKNIDPISPSTPSLPFPPFAASYFLIPVQQKTTHGKKKRTEPWTAEGVSSPAKKRHKKLSALACSFSRAFSELTAGAHKQRVQINYAPSERLSRALSLATNLPQKNKTKRNKKTKKEREPYHSITPSQPNPTHPDPTQPDLTHQTVQHTFAEQPPSKPARFKHGASH